MRASDIWQVDFPLEAGESKVQPARQKLLPRPGWVACRNEEKTKSHASLRVRCTDISVLAGCISAGAIVSPASRPASECNKIVIVSPPQGLMDRRVGAERARARALRSFRGQSFPFFFFFFPLPLTFFNEITKRFPWVGSKLIFPFDFSIGFDWLVWRGFAERISKIWFWSLNDWFEGFEHSLQSLWVGFIKFKII